MEDSPKHKIRSSICFSCCFGTGRREPAGETDERPRLIGSSSAWIRSKAQEIPELKEKARNVISRMGRSRRHSSDFRYDPLSYALNFDEGDDESQIDDFRYRNFSSRLTATPPQEPAQGSLEITCS